MSINGFNKRKLAQVIPFGIISCLYGLVYSFLEFGILLDAPIYPSTGNPYYFSPVSSGLLSLMAGLVIGMFEVIYLNSKFRNTSFFKKIFYKTIIYLLLITFVVFLISLLGHALELKRSPLDELVLSYNANFMRSVAFWSIVVYMAHGIVVMLFYTEVSDNIGQGVLLNFFTGKYYRPIEEDRIFMFLDMKDSTAIAERLGHMKYFDMLKEYYDDLTDPIIKYGGQIYQYVGDEIVVTWRKHHGIHKNNCIRCFFEMRSSLRNQSQKYERKYGVVPSFKAGLHIGRVTSGEIGVIKKDIIFTGDVLNTTARIQGLCNVKNVDLLISEQLISELSVSKLRETIEIGEVQLRGKNEKITLYTIRLSQDK
ncbi:MAG: adenylate/guanylate cyclase domain-containing protein [Bacteroidota bacterium]